MSASPVSPSTLAAGSTTQGVSSGGERGERVERRQIAAAAPAWSFYWLWAAGIYNLVWGLATIAAPHLLFDLTGIPRVN